MADDLRARLLAGLDGENQGGGITREQAADVMLSLLRDHSCEHCQDADPALCVFAPCGPDDLRRGYAERTIQQWSRYAKHWQERAEQAERRAATTGATVSRVRELADVYELNASTVDGVAARNFFELFAAELRDALNPPPALLAEEETGRHGQP